MKKEFFEILRSRLLSNLGPSRFNTFMLKHIDHWEFISYDQIKELVEEIKFHGSTYSFFPFCYLFLEIDLYKYYLKRANEDWDKEKADIHIRSFRSHSIDQEEKITKLEYFNSIHHRLEKIRERLLKEGAYQIEGARPKFNDEVSF